MSNRAKIIPTLFLVGGPLALLAGCDPAHVETVALAWWHVWAPVAVVLLSTLVTALGKYPKAATVVGALKVLLDLLSVAPHSDSPGAVKLPLTRSRKPNSDGKLPPPKIGPALIFFGFVFLAASLPACACWQPSSPKFATKQCTLARQGVDCSKASAQSLAAPGMAVAKTLIDSGTVDVPTVEGALIQMGFSSAQCILSALAADFSKPRASSDEPAAVQQYRAAFVANWKAAS